MSDGVLHTILLDVRCVLHTILLDVRWCVTRNLILSNLLFYNRNTKMCSITIYKCAIISKKNKHLSKRHFQQCFSYIVAVRFLGGGIRSTWRKPPQT